MADPMPPPGTADDIYARVLEEHDRRLRELEAPAGTQRAQTMGDLLGRASHTLTPAAMSIGMGSPGVFYSGTRPFTFPAPSGGARSAVLMLSASLSNSEGNANPISAFAGVIYQSVYRWRGRASAPAATSAPAGWDEVISAVAPVVVPADTEPTFALTVHGTTFMASPTPWLNVTNITAVLLYGDRL